MYLLGLGFFVDVMMMMCVCVCIYKHVKYCMRRPGNIVLSSKYIYLSDNLIYIPITYTHTIGPKGYFLIIDKLNETLDARIKRWKKAKKKSMKKAAVSQIVPLRVGRRGYRKSASADEAGSRNNANGTNRSSGINNPLITEDQLDVALQISSALMYLHEKNIMFRDLKPQNIGFDGKEE